MSITGSPTTSSTVDCAATAVLAAVDQFHHRLSSKRKLDDYGGPTFSDEEDDALLSDLVHVRMRKDEPNAIDSSSNGVANLPHSSANSDALNPRVPNARSASHGESAHSESTRSRTMLQFFIRTMSGGNNLVIQAYAHDKVKSLHNRIQTITGIPVFEQRLIYRGKQLQPDQSLAECAIQNDASLQLVGRLRSTDHPQAWQLLEDIVSAAFRMCRGEELHEPSKYIKSRMSQYLTMAQKEMTAGYGVSHIRVFLPSSAPLALLMLYVSPLPANRTVAENSIKYFLNSYPTLLPKHLHNYCAPIVLEFCKFLRRLGEEDPLYLLCRGSLGSLLESDGNSQDSEPVEGLIGGLKEISPFVRELSRILSRDLVVSMDLPASGRPLSDDVRDFRAFLLPLRTAVASQVCFKSSNPASLKGGTFRHPLYGEEIELLHFIYADLLKKMKKCLGKMEESLAGKGKVEGDVAHSGWSQYLAVLKELSGISMLYQSWEEQFKTILRLRRAALCALVVKYAMRSDDHQWLIKHKDVLDFESRRHLAMMMFPDVKEDYEELHEMLIDRSQILAESFEYIGRAEPELLHGGLFMEFKNEEATGPGVLREWFFLVCQAIFNPQNALFVACPNDCRRFYPNPASKVDPLHLEYFTFAGRVIALALMHKVQVGIVFDRVFFQQLAGDIYLSLEDIRDADPVFYNSCKKILEMDAKSIDNLGLTFVREVEELGLRKTVELCPAGESIVVNSENKGEYVNLLIQHRFVTSISEQVSHFAQGFADILCGSRLQSIFFRSLELEDLDWMLHGSESAISVEDWKAHTDYNGYKETDPQILWFWKIVGEMSAEQKKVLLFFWTSVKYLPVEGFRGLASRLYIYKSSEAYSRLPSSHTCFYRLCFPPYPSEAEMKSRLDIITQDHVGSSFGTW
ncbi:E3 ubiquitin-protein ligase UPL5-like [Pyrus ussuriensis x Pyrus communis]|uniref:HECT-type E3 ubiquitin transferase n=1 Tax=Pyrus ussuriensis x Pyrus communis TaxID=2448454 RepID=A0A5N5FCT1_9ROSA|nr:E3 ubiquitin-protein ligase UPL5 [Pyrus x bretschneideri]KAB2600905.1 E3 ubiquitin-protein ligase UPL5-like [Pyrus ussuriensis x Pyrus communis]